jgi:hypothetical protein
MDNASFSIWELFYCLGQLASNITGFALNSLLCVAVPYNASGKIQILEKTIISLSFSNPNILPFY